MPEVNTCPETTLLRQFLHGRLDEPEAGPIERHLEECPACVAALAPELDAVRAELPRGPAAESVLDATAMVERVWLALIGGIAAPSTPFHFGKENGSQLDSQKTPRR